MLSMFIAEQSKERDEVGDEVQMWLYTHSIRSSDNDSTGFCPPGSLHTLGADGHI